MKITIYNFKGGTGKTSIALNLALTMNYGIISNDIYTPFDKILDKKKFIQLKPDQDLPDLPPEYDIIFDLGGHIDPGAISAVQQSDWIIVPVTGDFIDVQVTINCISEIKAYNDRIIVTVNRTAKGEYEAIRKGIMRFFSYPVFEIRKSKALPNIFREKKSVHDMVAEGGLKKYHYESVAKQFDAIIRYMKGEKL